MAVGSRALLLPSTSLAAAVDLLLFPLDWSHTLFGGAEGCEDPKNVYDTSTLRLWPEVVRTSRLCS